MNHESRIDELLNLMTLEEKLGQLYQSNSASEDALEQIRLGRIGSLLNVKNEENAKCREAAKASRLGIPLVIGLDVIHGYKTILPIPLGQAATFHPSLVHAGARIAAHEVAASGIDWTFSPMVDISRDPRWGRIAEGYGEDPYLSGILGAAAVEGYQGVELGASANNRQAGLAALSLPGSIAACVKHYVGYGAAESGRDYNTTEISEHTLRNVYLQPFHACIEAGCATVMSAFNDLNGVPTSGNEWTIRQILKTEWAFDGVVVSDWSSIWEMMNHGYCTGEEEAAFKALRAGVDMEMMSECYLKHAATLLEQGKIQMEWIDDAVRRVLRFKFRLGLFEEKTIPWGKEIWLDKKHLETAKQASLESLVLLKNDNLLPFERTQKIAVLGPLAHSPREQMGCWITDGDAGDVITPLTALREAFGEQNIIFASGLETARSKDRSGWDTARQAVEAADSVVVFVGEDDRLSGEAHCRAFLDLPGLQGEFLEHIAETGKPIAVVVMAGRPLILTPWSDKVQAIVYAWHPGTMGGPAIADLLTGKQSPSGRLPVSFPRAVGQVPIYYNQKKTGRPALPGGEGIPVGTPENPIGFSSRHMDVQYTPAYPFGFGLAYTEFEFSLVSLSSSTLKESITATVTIKNIGQRAGTAVPQLYIQDLAGSVTRPVKELKGFQKVDLLPGEAQEVCFTLHQKNLVFWTANHRLETEPGDFLLWITNDSRCNDQEGAAFRVA
jgi:beta-glucosidase